MLTKENKEKMWSIDCKAQLGDNLTEEEIQFFNAHFEMMQTDMTDNYEHWQYHTKKIN